MRYRVRALGPDGVVTLDLDAGDEREAGVQAAGRGYTVLSVAGRRARLAGTAERFGLLLFTQELLVLLSAGLGLIEALQALAEKQTSDAGRHVLEALLAQLRDGKPLSAAMAQQPAVFPALYVATVRASERTGSLVESLSRYAAYQGQVEALRAKMVSALLYPVLLLGVGLAVALFLLGYVVPRFAGVYTDLGRDLPLASRLLFEFGVAIDRHAALAGALAVAAIGVAVWAARTMGFKSMLLSALATVPAAAARLRVFQLTRFYRTVGMLLRGGVPLVTAMDMAAGLLDARLRDGLAAATRAVREGAAASDAFERHGLTTPIALRMLRVGERSGELGELMERAAAFHDEELTRWVERFARLFEPLLMMLIGLLIGAIVVLMYLPIFELAGALQ